VVLLSICHVGSDGWLLVADTVCRNEVESSTIPSDEFAVRPSAKAGGVQSCCNDMGSIASHYSKECAAGLVFGLYHINTHGIGQFGMHEGFLK